LPIIRKIEAKGYTFQANPGFSTLITGFLLQLFGSTPEQSLGVQLTGPVAALFLMVGVIVFSRYPQKEIAAYQANKALWA